jgi:hypothetical protein
MTFKSIAMNFEAVVKKFDLCVTRKFDPCVVKKFDLYVAKKFDLCVAKKFDPASSRNSTSASPRNSTAASSRNSTSTSPRNSTPASSRPQDIRPLRRQDSSTPAPRTFDLCVKILRPPRQGLSTSASRFFDPRGTDDFVECQDALRPLRANASSTFLTGVTLGKNIKAKFSSTTSRLLSKLSICFQYF